jgi:hypothetical protein
VPAFFVLMDDLSRAIWWVFSRFVGEADEPADEAEAFAAARLGHHLPAYPAERVKFAAE